MWIEMGGFACGWFVLRTSCDAGKVQKNEEYLHDKVAQVKRWFLVFEPSESEEMDDHLLGACAFRVSSRQFFFPLLLLLFLCLFVCLCVTLCFITQLNSHLVILSLLFWIFFHSVFIILFCHF